MNDLGTFVDARSKVLADVQRFLATVRQISATSIQTPELGIATLARLRRETYEDLNQIQHEYMIVCAADWFVQKARCPADTNWLWNPRQTGDDTEPDLRGEYRGVVVVSAEITTSQNPTGIIDSRMRNTLRKLSSMQGEKFYFASTASMCRRARTKVAKARWPIEVVHLEPGIAL
jgi:hypothetical protein